LQQAPPLLPIPPVHESASMNDSLPHTPNETPMVIDAEDCRLRSVRISFNAQETTDPHLVFLHEGLGGIDLWRDFPSLLCRKTGLPGIVYDRKGYGGSTWFEGLWSKDYHVREAAVYLSRILAAWGVSRAILVGHSDGGSIALLAAAMLPSVLQTVITEAAHIFVEKITLDGIRETVAAYETGGLKERLVRYHGANSDTLFYRWADTWLSPVFEDWSIESCLARITCPLLVLQGEADEYATSRQVEGIAAGVSGPVRTLMVPGCGHTPHFQAKTRVLSEMAAFISAVVNGRGARRS